MKTISIITPCYNEELNVRDCYEAIRTLFANELSGYRREHIFCDNASTDDTLKILRAIAAEDKDVKIIVNARNFGPLKNTFNGVLASSGDAVLLFMPADMQDPPELIPEFVKLWTQGYEIVYGIRATRNEHWLMRSVRNGYYRILATFSGIDLPPGVGDFQLVDRRVVDAMRNISDNYPFMRLMTFECGGRAIGVPYAWRVRKKGKSKNRLTALFGQGMAGIVSFTTAPLRISTFVGFILAVLSLVYGFGTMLIGLLVDQDLASPGIMTIIVAIFFFAGVQLFFMGMIGEYILAIYGQVRDRPLVFERERVNFQPDSRETPKSSSQTTSTEH